MSMRTEFQHLRSSSVNHFSKVGVSNFPEKPIRTAKPNWTESISLIISVFGSDRVQNWNLIQVSDRILMTLTLIKTDQKNRIFINIWLVNPLILVTVTLIHSSHKRIRSLSGRLRLSTLNSLSLDSSNWNRKSPIQVFQILTLAATQSKPMSPLLT